MAVPQATSVDIRDILSTAGVGTVASTSGWSLQVSREPAVPDSVVTIYDTGGFESNAKWLLDNPTVQVRVRGNVNAYPAAYAKAQEVKDILLGIQPQTRNGTDYIGIWQTSDILFLQYDESNRPILVSNWRIVREPSSTGTPRLPL
jgi:hypothetical protein